MHGLVKVLFFGHAEWDAEADRLKSAYREPAKSVGVGPAPHPSLRSREELAAFFGAPRRNLQARHGRSRTSRRRSRVRRLGGRRRSRQNWRDLGLGERVQCWEAQLQDNDVDFVRGVCAVHFRGLRALVSMAGNIGVKPGMLDRFVIKGEPLPDSVMSKLVGELFHTAGPMGRRGPMSRRRGEAGDHAARYARDAGHRQHTGGGLMPGGRRNDYMLAKPPADASTKVAEALLQSEMLKSSPNSLLIRFDRPTDTSAALDVLRAMRDGYKPPRD